MDHLHELATSLSFEVLQRRISKGEIQNPVLQAIKYEPVKKFPIESERETRTDSFQVSQFDSIRRG